MSSKNKIKVRLPFDVGVVHFVGIGGIGMSGIASVMHNLGYKVRGSDIADGPNIESLRSKGIEVTVGHSPDNVEGAEAVIVSTAIRKDNVEVLAARAKHIPVVKRADMLAELMRLKWTISIAGTHGKTTTTTMVAALLDEAGFDPTVINGGVINAYGENSRLGEGDWMVVEADESDGTFIRLPTTIAVVTNIDPEHLDHWGDFDRLRAGFDAFIENIPFYGFAVVCLDHPEVQALVGRLTDRRLLTYGANPQADVRADNIRFENEGAHYDIIFRRHTHSGIDEESAIKDVFLPMPGLHNVLNSLPAAIIARHLGATDTSIKKAFSSFKGVKRRFTKIGEWQGLTVIDDYGHHPVEISAALRAARNVASGKIIAVLQPHRFSRVRDLFDQFCGCLNEADTVFVTNVYTAGENPIEGACRDDLIAGIKEHGHRDVRALDTFENLAGEVAAIGEPGDYVVCLGAGDITKYANGLIEDFGKLGK